MQNFDLILAMDQSNLEDLESFYKGISFAEPRLFLHGVPGYGNQDVPDPYEGSAEDFEHVLDLIELGVDHLIEVIRDQDRW